MKQKGSSQAHTGSNKSNKKSQRGLALAVLLVILAGCTFFLLSDASDIAELRNDFLQRIGFTQNGVEEPGSGEEPGGGEADDFVTLDGKELPAFDGKNYVEINGGVPLLPAEVYAEAGLVNSNGKWKTEGTLRGVDSNKLNKYEHYGELDNQGRCTVAYGCLGLETMPPEGDNRGDIGSVHPSGWAKAQNWERCHLIAWALSDEDANERNLVTGTHYMNYDGMRPLEEEVEHYIWRTGNHVLYYAKPIFKGKEMVCRGVHMIAWSVEDNGEGISFNNYCFNVTPGATIDYKTGIVTTAEQASQEARLYVINTRSHVFHYPTCEGAQQISKWNRKEVTATRVELTEQGYTPCGYCEP